MRNTSLLKLIEEEKHIEKEMAVANAAYLSTISSSLDCNSITKSNSGATSSRISKSNKRINPLEEEYDDNVNINSIRHEGVIITVVGNEEEEEEDKEEVNEVNSDVLEASLPITQSRKGNLCFCIFHLLSSGVGIQALSLPLAFASLGWIWGTMWLLTTFIWQLYTIWLLVHLHESASGYRYSRYLQLAMAAFGPKLGKLLALLPVMYLSGGTCVMLLITGGGMMQQLHQILCEDGHNCSSKSLTTVEWYLVFICLAIVIAQLPNLNSVAWVSLVSAITALVYCSLIWVLSVSKDRPSGSRYSPSAKGSESEMRRVMEVLSAVGLISFSFRGHNLVLEIQGTLPAKSKDPIHKRMWKGVTISYALIALCLFPLAIGGYWAYGTLMPKKGMLHAFRQFHGHHSSKLTLAIIYSFLIINSLCSFQIYAMPVFDNLELRYMSIRKKPCTWWIRVILRVFFGGFAFFIAVAIPFLPLLSPLVGGIALPLTYAYPCLMWILIKKPRQYGSMWWLNLLLGCLGILVSVLLVTTAIWHLVTDGLSANFFHPKP